jgi:hypothetical protein
MPAIAAFLIDLVLVIVFVLIGRASHGEDAAGTLNTLWPFAVGLVSGWAAMRAWRTPRRVLWTGIGVWAITVGVGMLLRVVSGQGIQLSFVIVASLVLGAFLLGWRGIAAAVARLRVRRG